MFKFLMSDFILVLITFLSVKYSMHAVYTDMGSNTHSGAACGIGRLHVPSVSDNAKVVKICSIIYGQNRIKYAFMINGHIIFGNDNKHDDGKQL